MTAQALGKIGAAAVGELAELLKDKKPEVVVSAAEALRLAGPEAEKAVPALTDVAKRDGPNDPARMRAVMALGKVGPKAKGSVPVLTDIVKGKGASPTLRVQAVIALGQIGPDAKESVPTLAETLTEPESKSGPLRIHAATSLGQIGGAKSVTALVKLMEDAKGGPARVMAVRALGEIGPDAKDALPNLEKAQLDSTLSDAAHKAIEKIKK
jgi:HEAT repeat protein